MTSAASSFAPDASASSGAPTILHALRSDKQIDAERYHKRLRELQQRLNRLGRKAQARGVSAILLFEGWDAAGKGGAIRRVTGALDARFYNIVPVAAPSDEELARPYLWRFWRHVPGRGRFAIFDRSWYGRVLVERIEGFCAPADWRRAYAEINAFEDQLADAGAIVLKFWLATSADEQLRRFREREATGHKRYKITDEDWRNREKWDAYEAAASDMIEKTSTEAAPWHLVAAEDKYHARIAVLKALCNALEGAVGRDEKPRAKKPGKRRR